jgi:hypothetical protein
MSAHGQAKFVDINFVREIRPVPTYIVLVVRSEDSFVKILKGGLKPRRTRPLQDHRPLLREGRRNRPRAGAARHPKVDRCLRAAWSGDQSQAADACRTKQPSSRQPLTKCNITLQLTLLELMLIACRLA